MLPASLLCQLDNSDWYPAQPNTATGGTFNQFGDFVMARCRKSLVKPRLIAFNRQAGRCFYCEQPMWMNNLDEFASSHRLEPSQAMRLKCTGEHLQAHSEGGSADRTNIVAACAYCNRLRHQRKEPPTPEDYKALVSRRLSQGKWHGLRL